MRANLDVVILVQFVGVALGYLGHLDAVVGGSTLVSRPPAQSAGQVRLEIRAYVVPCG